MRRSRKLVLSGLFLLALLEVVPRVVELPGLERETLDPPELASPEERAFAPHPYLVLSPKPGHERVGPGGHQFSHSEQGFRGRALERPKPPGRLRIACLGGSSTYGTGPSSDAATWPARLEALLQESLGADAVDVLNAGAPTWNSFETLGNLAFRVLPFEPDVVVVYHSTNDVTPALWPGAVADNTHYRATWPTYRRSPLEPYLERSVVYLIWRRYATSYVEERVDLAYRGVRIPEDFAGDPSRLYEVNYVGRPLPDQGFENFRRNLVSITALARAHGAEPVLLTQAVWPPDGAAAEAPQWRDRLRGMDRATEIIEAVALERGVPLLDMRSYLEGEAQGQVARGERQSVLRSGVHLTDRGAALLAARLADELSSLGLLEAAAGAAGQRAPAPVEAFFPRDAEPRSTDPDRGSR